MFTVWSLNSWIGGWWWMMGNGPKGEELFYLGLEDFIYFSIYNMIQWSYYENIPYLQLPSESSAPSFVVAFSHSFSTNENNQKTSHCRSSATIHPTICRKKTDQRTAQVLFALHDPRSSRGGGKIKHCQLQRRENTEVCDVWLFDGKKMIEIPWLLLGHP